MRLLPTGTPAELAVVRQALRPWQVNQVVITGSSRDPVYASGFFTSALGVAPVFERRRLGVDDRAGGAVRRSRPPGIALSPCRQLAGLRRPSATSR